MANCNTRLIYDKCAFEERIEESKRPLGYIVNTNQYQHNNMRPSTHIINNEHYGGASDVDPFPSSSSW